VGIWVRREGGRGTLELPHLKSREDHAFPINRREKDLKGGGFEGRRI
jgi:hypothetical protein